MGSSSLQATKRLVKAVGLLGSAGASGSDIAGKESRPSGPPEMRGVLKTRGALETRRCQTIQKFDLLKLEEPPKLEELKELKELMELQEAPKQELLELKELLKLEGILKPCGAMERPCNAMESIFVSANVRFAAAVSFPDVDVGRAPYAWMLGELSKSA